MGQLEGKHILLGVCGGIAAYKTPALVRLLRQEGAEVQVVMTASAARFVTATALQAVSGNPVRDTLWDAAAEAQMGHIELARWADLVLIAPATADRLSRLAGGHADDLLGALCLATRAPLLLAPAMNQVMWEAPATRRNAGQLEADGAAFAGPDDGDQACGEVGPGRMVEPEDLLRAVVDRIADRGARAGVRDVSLAGPVPGPLAGLKVVVTAGPTREAIDPVRYLSNHSSGRQGYAIAQAAAEAGADVTLISGPVTQPPPAGVTLVSVESARDMHAASLNAAAGAHLFVAVAAVADYRPKAASGLKLKKEDQDGSLTLDLVENPDIIAAVAALPDRPVVVGFAAETHDALGNARAKLKRKGLDAIVVNDVSRTDIGFGTKDNAATLIWADGELELGKQDKLAMAREIISRLATLFVRQLAHTNPENVAN
jgi:phosphopantothenoylcysteine decarboxylase/phosphopantothenate--cysteine ligase